jgi:hypothetical protein
VLDLVSSESLFSGSYMEHTSVSHMIE